MNTKAMHEAILVDALVLVDKIRAFSWAQKEFWQKIPWLALRVCSHYDHNDNQQYEVAFRNGLWLIKASVSTDTVFGSYTVAVDCATGDLCRGARRGESADNTDILRCVAHLEQFNAEEIVAQLRELAMLHREPNEFFTKTAERLKLKEIYTRD